MDVPGRSGNTLKVPGSRPGRPTRCSEPSRSCIPTVAVFTSWKEILSLSNELCYLWAPTIPLEDDTEGPRPSSLTNQRSTSVLQEKNQVKLVSWALLQFRNKVQIEGAGSFALRVNQRPPTTNVIAEGE